VAAWARETKIKLLRPGHIHPESKIAMASKVRICKFLPHGQNKYLWLRRQKQSYHLPSEELAHAPQSEAIVL